MKIRPNARKRFTLIRIGPLLHVWQNWTHKGLRSWSVKALWFATWNSRTGNVSIDGPGPLNAVITPDKPRRRRAR